MKGRGILDVRILRASSNVFTMSLDVSIFAAESVLHLLYSSSEQDLFISCTSKEFFKRRDRYTRTKEGMNRLALDSHGVQVRSEESEAV